MDRADVFRKRCAYTAWANGRILSSADGLSDEELGAPRAGTAYGTLARDLQHIIDAQLWWESVMVGSPRMEPDPPAPEADVIATLRNRFEDSHAGLQRLCDSLADESLDGVAGYKDRGGSEYRFPRWEMLEHVLNHGTQHRGEIGILLHQMGRSPGDIDFLDWVESTGG